MISSDANAEPAERPHEPIHSRIFSPALRKLTLEPSTFRTGLLLTRALELFPAALPERKGLSRGSFSIKSTSETKKVTTKYFPTNRPQTLLELSEPELNQLWGEEGRGHEDFRKFIDALAECKKNAVHWADGTGRVRTLRPVFRRPFMKTISNTDPGSDAPYLKRGFIRFRKSERGYVKLDAATSLALASLSRGDHHNFARIVAAYPPIVARLLDRKKVGHGCIFTDQNIWLILAYGIVRIAALGGATSEKYSHFSIAFANYLAFHNPEGLPGPYVVALRWAYKDSGQNIDALANSKTHFYQNIERLWERLCPEKNPIRDIIDVPVSCHDLDTSILAPFLNIVSRGIDLHLAEAKSRYDSYNLAIKSALSLGAALPITAAKNAMTSIDGGLTADTIGRIGDYLISEFSDRVAAIKQDNDLSRMREMCKILYLSLQSNCADGRLVFGQTVMSENQLRALRHESIEGPVVEADLKSREGDPSSIRHFYETVYIGKDKIRSSSEFEEIRSRRVIAGERQKQALEKVELISGYA